MPWALLPGLRPRVLSVAPSAACWLRAHRADRTPGGAVVLVRGPGLASEGAEVPELATDYAGDGELVVLAGGTATNARVLDAIDGARLVHIAAHGTFRADSPLFSSLQLADGPLTVYDLERLRRAPRQIVLSSAYRMSSTLDQKAFAIDGDNRLLWLLVFVPLTLAWFGLNETQKVGFLFIGCFVALLQHFRHSFLQFAEQMIGLAIAIAETFARAGDDRGGQADHVRDIDGAAPSRDAGDHPIRRLSGRGVELHRRIHDPSVVHRERFQRGEMRRHDQQRTGVE